MEASYQWRVVVQVVVLWILDLVTLSYELSPTLEKMMQVRRPPSPMCSVNVSLECPSSAGV